MKKELMSIIIASIIVEKVGPCSFPGHTGWWFLGEDSLTSLLQSGSEILQGWWQKLAIIKSCKAYYIVCSDVGLMLETSALKLFTVANLRYQLSW